MPVVNPHSPFYGWDVKYPCLPRTREDARMFGYSKYHDPTKLCRCGRSEPRWVSDNRCTGCK